MAGLEREADSRAIVRTIATLAHELGLAVTAEGVETAGQAAFLQEVGATWAQGFYFARPMNGEALGALFQSTARLPTRRETDNAVLSPSAHGAFLGRTDAALALRDVAG